MGIPSFYRHLCRKYPCIISNGVSAVAGQTEWLCLDFNCAMYYVLRKQPSIESATSQAAWEADFAKAIADYMREIILLIRPTKGVYVSCDGAVCAAKRRQQRLRRFKGPWIAAAEAEVRGQAGEPAITRTGWDQNALTPGTAFMATLGRVLVAEGARIAAREGIQVTVSTTSEHGEGEHKLLRAMRALSPAPKSCVIYGLDADLILLSMLLGADTGASVHLLREAQEFEGAASEGEWRCLSVGELVKVLLPGGHRVADFVAGMSLLGNDFLPRSLTKTVRDDGIPTLIRTLDQQVWRQGLSLVDPVSGAITRAGLLAIIEAWAATEDEDLVTAAKEAQRSATRPAGIGASPAETALREWSAQPARWAAVTRLLTATGETRRAIYARWINHTKDDNGLAANYCAGVAWTWDYYSGRAVDQGWVFDEHLPPLWSDVAAYLSITFSGTTVPAPTIKYPTPLPDWLHLLAVLPMESLRCLLPTDKQTLALTHPWYWPTEWALFDVGRGQMWECEAMIPLIPELVLRTVDQTVSQPKSKKAAKK
jgi:5'-3' exonuclease